MSRDRLATYNGRVIFWGGKPKSRSTNGTLSPGLIVAKALARGAATASTAAAVKTVLRTLMVKQVASSLDDSMMAEDMR